LFLADKTRIDRTVPPAVVEVAFDPQTSGGLVIAIAEAQAPALVRALHDRGINEAVVIGRANSAAEVAVRLV
jgi:selenide,water dikinase